MASSGRRGWLVSRVTSRYRGAAVPGEHPDLRDDSDSRRRYSGPSGESWPDAPQELTVQIRRGLLPTVALAPEYFRLAVERARDPASGWSLRYLRWMGREALPAPPTGMTWLGCEVGVWEDEWSNYLLVWQDASRLAPLTRHRSALNEHGLFGTVEDAWSFWDDWQRLFATNTEDMETLDPDLVSVIAIAGLDPIDGASPEEWIERMLRAERTGAHERGAP